MKMTSRFIRLIGGSVGLALSIATVGSVDAALLYTSSGGLSDPNSKFTIGLEFTPGADISVTGLGVFDGGSDGASASCSLSVSGSIGWNN